MFLELRGRPTGTASVHVTNSAHRTGTVAATVAGTLKASIPHRRCTSTEELQVLPSHDKSKTHVDKQEKLHTNQCIPTLLQTLLKPSGPEQKNKIDLVDNLLLANVFNLDQKGPHNRGCVEGGSNMQFLILAMLFP